MDLNRFTEKSLEAIKEAESRALRLNHMEIEPEHLWLALQAQSNGLLSGLLRRLNVSSETLEKEVEGLLKRKPTGNRTWAGTWKNLFESGC